MNEKIFFLNKNNQLKKLKIENLPILNQKKPEKNNNIQSFKALKSFVLYVMMLNKNYKDFKTLNTSSFFR